MQTHHEIKEANDAVQRRKEELHEQDLMADQKVREFQDLKLVSSPGRSLSSRCWGREGGDGDGKECAEAIWVGDWEMGEETIREWGKETQCTVKMGDSVWRESRGQFLETGWRSVFVVGLGVWNQEGAACGEGDSPNSLSFSGLLSEHMCILSTEPDSAGLVRGILFMT